MHEPVVVEQLQTTPDLLRQDVSAPHPEEMKAGVHLRLGKLLFQAQARTTPAGLIATGLAISAVLLSVASIVRASRNRR